VVGRGFKGYDAALRFVRERKALGYNVLMPVWDGGQWVVAHSPSRIMSRDFPLTAEMKQLIDNQLPRR